MEFLEHGYIPPTPEKGLFNAYTIAKKAGLYYIGNLTRSEHTRCPKCSRLIIKRVVFGIEKIKLNDNGNCIYYGFPIAKIYLNLILYNIY